MDIILTYMGFEFRGCRLKYELIIFGRVAQLVEQRTENPCVGGSIPPPTTSVLLCLRSPNVFNDNTLRRAFSLS